MPGEPLLLGIDGGQTATKALLARPDGQVLAGGRGGPSDHFHAVGGRERNRAAILGATDAALRAAGAAHADVAAVALGLTGAPTAPEAPRLAEAIVRETMSPDNVLVVADYVTNLAGASGGQPGVVVIAGGGSIAFGTATDGREAVAGGWGYLLGDEGSGFDIGRRAIAAACRASDGRGPATALEERVRAAFDLGDMREVTRVVYREGFGRDRISLLAPIVADAARNGDRAATGIMRDAGTELALAVLAVVGWLFEPDDPALVYPTGGVFAAGESIRRPFSETLVAGRPGAAVAEPAFPPAVGALILAARQAGVDVSEVAWQRRRDAAAVEPRLDGAVDAGGRARVERFAVVGKLAIGDRLEDGAVVIEDGRIAALPRRPHPDDLPPLRIEAGIVAPGLIDLQVNGGFGVEVGNDPDAIRHLARALPRTGVTAFLPTIISSPAEAYPGIFDAFDAARDATGARALGLHLEGPFLSPTRPGAHRRETIEAADDSLFDALIGRNALRLMTLAPEWPGAVERIRRLRYQGIVASLGHSDASYEQFVAGIEAGATMATHLFNTMSPFGHRAPGAIGATLVEDGVVAGLIVDGVHCHPAAVRLALAAKGARGIALVSDMIAAGMPPGRYELGGRAVESDGASARLDDGTLAGSVLTMDLALRNVVAWCGVGPATALRLASEVPAKLLGLERSGRLGLGADADLVLFDDGLEVMATIVGGRTVYDSRTA